MTRAYRLYKNKTLLELEAMMLQTMSEPKNKESAYQLTAKARKLTADIAQAITDKQKDNKPLAGVFIA